MGEVPRVVGTVTTPGGLAGLSSTDGLCHILEVRLDLIGVDSSWLDECRRLQRAQIPVILTLRTTTEGGKFSGSKQELLSLYRQAISMVSAVDVELSSGNVEAVLELVQAHGKAAIISFHDFTGTPSSERLHGIVQQAVKYPAVVKISTMINGRVDVERLRALLKARAQRPLCVIGMGPLGQQTRIEFAAEGSCLTYGYIDAVAAPGQLHARELLRALGNQSA